MPSRFTSRRIVEFVETDMAGILHFSNYFRYMEAAEHEFFRSLGFSVHPHAHGEVLGWARGHAECTYRRPLRYEDEVELNLFVREKTGKAITYEVVFTTAASGEVARGRMTAVCVGKAPGEERLRAIPIPPEIDAAIDVAPSDS